ncbi:MAG TPA: LuxR C-terminal-related transcriptional regulator [Trebonia sp.]|jgi:non-specific serine/threonine protein kinase|nr:LuxR C-terminal-related transcriptional regulator [Trebonia sp.]
MIAERRDNLPTKATSFVGRKRELAEVAQALDAHRLVTLRGPAGVGKTRLALMAATAARDTFGQRAWLVELSSLADPELLAAEVAKALGLPDAGLPDEGGDPARVLARQLAEFELLLVLDTCEHLGDACAALAATLLDSCPDLRILATSREPLGAGGEHVVVVAPLDASAASSDAVELLLDRARSAVPGYALTAGNAAAVVRLCQKLDGIPLAIELAAVRLRSLTADEITDRLDDRFRILGTARTSTGRHRTLRAAVDWSYELCTPAEQRLWRVLSVFPGELSGAAAAAVGGPGTGEVLARLGEKSIIGPAAGPAGDRYVMLDTMREFGAEAARGPDRDAALRRHRDYFLAQAERAAAEAATREQVSWMTWAQQESGNLRAALDFSFTAPGEAGAGVRLTLALRNYWLMAGTFGEGMRWHELAMATRPGRAGDDRERAREGAWAAYGAGVLAAQQGDLATAGPLLDRAAAAAGELGDAALAAFTADGQGSVAFYGGDNKVAHERYATALDSFDAAGVVDPFALVCFSRLASAALVASDLDRAVALCEECVRRCDELGEQWARSTAIWTQAAARWLGGDAEGALLDSLRCLQVKEAIGDLHTATMCVDLIAVCLATRGGAALAGLAAGNEAADGSATGGDGADERSRVKEGALADFRRAAELGGAGDAMWQLLNAPLQMGQAYAEIRKDAAAKCQAALGGERFAAALRRGLALSLTEAIALARGEKAPAGPAGTRPLTRREREIAGLVADGLGNREIAGRLFLSKRTVDSHIEHIFGKLGFTARAQLCDWVLAQARL